MVATDAGFAAGMKYLRTGRGDPVILVHGGAPGASGMNDFGPIIGDLATDFEVIVPDLPGYGESPLGDYDGTFNGHVAGRLNELVAELGLRQVHAVGNSLGASVLVRLVIDDPQVIARLVLIAPAGVGAPMLSPAPSEGQRLLRRFSMDPTEQNYAAFLSAQSYAPDAIGPAVVADRYASVTSEGRMDPLRRVLSSIERGLWQRLDEVSRPTLLLWGQDDRLAALEGALWALRRLPEAELHVIGRCGHDVVVDQPARLAHAIRGYLSPAPWGVS